VIGPTRAAIETGYESEVDAALKTWRQGDVIIGEGPGFLYISDLSKPLSPPARKEADSGFDEGEKSHFDRRFGSWFRRCKPNLRSFEVVP
jgi:hypothetical protein